MGLRDRAQQHDIARAGTPGGESQTPKTPVSLFDQPRWGIVDGELVEINGVTDVPGMSPAYLCSDGKEGWSALVPFRETRYFNTARQAIDALQTMGRTTGTTTSTR
jgi:hypothetical protein